MGNIRSRPYITKESRDNFDRIFGHGEGKVWKWKDNIPEVHNYTCYCGGDIYLTEIKYKKLMKKLKLIHCKCECKALASMNLV